MYAHDVCHEYVLRGHDENDSYQHDDESNQNGDEPQRHDSYQHEYESQRPVATVTMNEAATTQMRGAMKIAAQSVVAYLPIVRLVPLRPDARASGRKGAHRTMGR